MLADGDKAPDFDLEGSNGARINLSALKGKLVVLYFYPKDDTSGCTVEARDFSALQEKFAALGAVVLGVSPDSVASHDKFSCKYGLGFTLLADVEKSVAEAYGVWVQKSMYGKTYMGVERATFVIDKKGKIAKSWRKVKVPGHAAAVLVALEVLSG